MSLKPASRAVHNRVLSYTRLKPVNLQGVKAFKLRFNKDYTYTISAARALEYDDTPLHTMFDRRWKERKDSLWWSVIARWNFEKKRVVRSWACRRLRVAFVESLRKRGYASDGSRIDEAGRELPLVGTAQLSPELSILKIKLEALVQQTDQAVKFIIDRQNGDGGFSKGSGSRRILKR
jgi:hypothetical protein